MKRADKATVKFIESLKGKEWPNCADRKHSLFRDENLRLETKIVSCTVRITSIIKLCQLLVSLRGRCTNWESDAEDQVFVTATGSDDEVDFIEAALGEECDCGVVIGRGDGEGFEERGDGGGGGG